MGDVIPFRRARLSGFLPDDLGDAEEPRSAAFCRLVNFLKLDGPRPDYDLVKLEEFAKRGAPPDPDCS